MYCRNLLIFFAIWNTWIFGTIGQQEENKKSNRIFTDKSEYKEIIIIENNILWSSVLSRAGIYFKACASQHHSESMVTSAKFLWFITAFRTTMTIRSPVVVWLHSLENLSRKRWPQLHPALWGCAQTLPCRRRPGAGGQDTPAIYSSSLQPFGKEGNTQDMHWKRSQGIIWCKSYPCDPKVLAKGRCTGLHRVHAPSGAAGAGVAEQGPGEEPGPGRGAAGRGSLPPERTRGVNKGLASPSPSGGGADGKATNSAIAFVRN